MYNDQEFNMDENDEHQFSELECALMMRARVLGNEEGYSLVSDILTIIN